MVKLHLTVKTSKLVYINSNHVSLKKNTCTVSIPYALKVNFYIPNIRSKGIFQRCKPMYRRKIVPVVFFFVVKGWAFY